VDYWVGDGASGFCRLDNGALNISHLHSLNGTSEPYDDRPNSPYVFLADGAGTGVNRVTFGPDPNNPGHSLLADSGKRSRSSVRNYIYRCSWTQVFAQSSAKIGPDGLLYVVNQGDGNIVRVTNPRDPRPPSPLIQKSFYCGKFEQWQATGEHGLYRQ